MRLDILDLAQHPREFADLLLLAAYIAAVFVSLRWHRRIWICYALAALAYLIVVTIAEPEPRTPVPTPAQERPLQLCGWDEEGYPQALK